MVVGKGKTYCGEHSHEGGEDEACGRIRMPCPLDPKHTVFEDQLQKHLECCTAKKKTDVVYYEKNINSGIPNYRLSEEEQVSLASVPREKVKEMIEKVTTFYKEHCCQIEEEIMTHPVFNEEFSQSEYGAPALKHLKQQASLVGHLEEMNLLQPDTVYLEFGAGKGKLSHWIQQALPNSNNTEFVLIDRGSNRNKFDSYHKRNDQGPSFKRLRVDIEHLNLGRVDCVCDGSKSIVAASKHLCGAATDLTLRCLLETFHNQVPLNNKNETRAPDKTENNPKRPKTSSRISGIVVALCCHHQCYWPQYVGRAFLEELGFTASEFHLICCMSSWAVCGVRPSKADNNTDENDVEKQDNKETTILGGLNGDRDMGLSIAEREDIGRQCKRLLDTGRLMYLRAKGMTAKLCYYVDPSISLENVVLLATVDR